MFPADAAVGGDSNDPFDSGGATLANFRGDILGLPRIVVPTFPAGTCIVGPSSLFEVYEEVIGLLSVIEPSASSASRSPTAGTWRSGRSPAPAFVPLTPPAGLTVPSMIDITAQTAEDDDDDKSSKTAKKNG